MRATPLLLLVLAAGCIIETSDDDSRDPVDPPGSAARTVPLVPVSQGCLEEPSVFVRQASIVDRYVTIIAEHGGGCGDHSYKVCWDGRYGVGEPTQVALTLHDRTDDTCDAAVFQPIVIDLAELRRGSDDGQELEIVFPGGGADGVRYR